MITIDITSEENFIASVLASAVNKMKNEDHNFSGREERNIDNVIGWASSNLRAAQRSDEDVLQRQNYISKAFAYATVLMHLIE